MEIGAEWIYRLRDSSPLERVRILTLTTGKQRKRADVEFLDGEQAGAVVDIPQSRLRAPWSTLEEYEQRMADWERLDQFVATDVEEDASDMVFQLTIPKDVAILARERVKYMTELHDHSKLEALVGDQLPTIVAEVESARWDGITYLSREGTIAIAELVARRHPKQILEWVASEEAEAYEACKHGRDSLGLYGDEYTSSPYDEYDSYLKFQKPTHELLREWCGHRAVNTHERLVSAEAEVRRLDLLLGQAIAALKDHGGLLVARDLESDRAERITAANIRTVVERPLTIAEMPVREVRVSGRRWW